MGDNAEFEKLTVLEARLAAALDRIAVGLGDHQDTPAPLEDPGLTSAALEDAQIRADQAEQRAAEMAAQVAALEAQLDATTHAPGDDVAALQEERDALAQRVVALETARQADHDEASRALADAQSVAQRLEEAQAQLAEMSAAAPAPDNAQEIEELKDQVTDLTTRMRRLRKERDTARAEADPQASLKHVAELAVLRNEAEELRRANEELVASLAEMRPDGGEASGDASAALIVELNALRAARASEALELKRILAEIEDGPNDAARAGGDHA